MEGETPLILPNLACELDRVLAGLREDWSQMRVFTHRNSRRQLVS